MSLFGIVEGRVAEPELRFTPGGKAVLELRIAATRRAKEKDTGEWADDGAPLWVGATFWEVEAERIAESVSKGDIVTVTGDLVLEAYQKRDGSDGQKLIVRFPRFRGSVRKQGAPVASQPVSQSYPPSPAGNASWAANNADLGHVGVQQQAPF